MRSKTAQKILSETPQEVKDRVDEYTTQLLKDKGYIIGIDPYDENSVSESFGAEINVMNLDLSDNLKHYIQLLEYFKKSDNFGVKNN
jgi:hypothetical protein